MDLFKSIFASDEELEDDDDGEDAVDVVAVTQLSGTLDSTSTDFRPSVVSSAPILEEGERVDECEKGKESPKTTNAPDLSVHQLFQHLFNPEMDSGQSPVIFNLPPFLSPNLTFFSLIQKRHFSPSQKSPRKDVWRWKQIPWRRYLWKRRSPKRTSMDLPCPLVSVSCI